MGSEDFSQYGRTDAKAPGRLFWVGAVEPERWQAAQNGELALPSLHSPLFALDHEATIETGVTGTSTAALAVFAQ